MLFLIINNKNQNVINHIKMRHFILTSTQLVEFGKP